MKVMSQMAVGPASVGNDAVQLMGCPEVGVHVTPPSESATIKAEPIFILIICGRGSLLHLHAERRRHPSGRTSTRPSSETTTARVGHPASPT